MAAISSISLGNRGKWRTYATPWWPTRFKREARGRRRGGLKAEREETIDGDLQGILNAHLLVVVVVRVVGVVFTLFTVPTCPFTLVMVLKYPRNFVHDWLPTTQRSYSYDRVVYLGEKKMETSVAEIVATYGQRNVITPHVWLLK